MIRDKAINVKTTSSNKKTATRPATRPAARRVGSEQSATRALILETTEQLMRKEGYAAVSSRRVAKEANVKPSLIHYYFPTIDDLFLAVYRRATEAELRKQDKTYDSGRSLKALWDSYCIKKPTALSIEFMALANHRKAIKKEIASYTERTRRERAELLAKMVDKDVIQSDNCAPVGLSVLLLVAARGLVMEEGLGISLGHKEARVIVECLLEHLENPQN